MPAGYRSVRKMVLDFTKRGEYDPFVGWHCMPATPDRFYGEHRQ